MIHVFVSCDSWLATVSSHWEGFLPPVLDIDVFSSPPGNRRWQGWIMCKVITTPSSRNAGLMQLQLLEHTKEWWASPPQWHYLFTIRATTIAAALRKNLQQLFTNSNCRRASESASSFVTTSWLRSVCDLSRNERCRVRRTAHLLLACLRRRLAIWMFKYTKQQCIARWCVCNFLFLSSLLRNRCKSGVALFPSWHLGHCSRLRYNYKCLQQSCLCLSRRSSSPLLLWCSYSLSRSKCTRLRQSSLQISLPIPLSTKRPRPVFRKRRPRTAACI